LPIGTKSLFTLGRKVKKNSRRNERKKGLTEKVRNGGEATWKNTQEAQNSRKVAIETSKTKSERQKNN